MTNLEQQLENEFIALADESFRAIRYRPTYFLGMLRERGAVATARHLLHKESVSEGFTTLWQHHRLDLSLEAIILKPQYAALFSPDELMIARNRLNEVGYDFGD